VVKGKRKEEQRMADETHRTTPIEDTIEHVLPYPENFFIYKIPGVNGG
jgi:hypothetical protein